MGNVPPAPTFDPSFITNQIGSFMNRRSSNDAYQSNEPAAVNDL